MLSLVFFAASFAMAQEEVDVKGSADHPLFTRMPGYYIDDYESRDFDKFESSYEAWGKERLWEGKYTRIHYAIKTGVKQPSMLQIARNYKNAVKKIGGTVPVGTAGTVRVAEGKIEKNGGVVYIHAEAFNDGTDYEIVIIEKRTMQQDVMADADSLKESLAAVGKVTVAGLYFEADKAVLKAESVPALDEVVKLLKQNPALKLFVVGHVANVGSLESSLLLSQQRADAIVKALVAKGIAAARVKAVGVGPYSPVASNRTDEGKAKNRRVKLVEQ